MKKHLNRLGQWIYDNRIVVVKELLILVIMLDITFLIGLHIVNGTVSTTYILLRLVDIPIILFIWFRLK